MKPIKSPLRYPGGKSRAIDLILAQCPTPVAEVREAFVGGGSVFLALKSTSQIQNFWINDLNYDLCCFWRSVRDEIDRLLAAITTLKEEFTNGKALYLFLKDNLDPVCDFDRAVRFFYYESHYFLRRDGLRRLLSAGF